MIVANVLPTIPLVLIAVNLAARLVLAVLERQLARTRLRTERLKAWNHEAQLERLLTRDEVHDLLAEVQPGRATVVEPAFAPVRHLHVVHGGSSSISGVGTPPPGPWRTGGTDEERST